MDTEQRSTEELVSKFRVYLDGIASKNKEIEQLREKTSLVQAEKDKKEELEESIRKESVPVFYLREEIGRRLKIQESTKEMDILEFFIFVMGNFRILGDCVKQRYDDFLLPEEVTPDIMRSNVIQDLAVKN